jgi:hypothetical protein
MSYNIFATDYEARAFLAHRRAAGFRGCIVELRADCYEVRSWL